MRTQHIECRLMPPLRQKECNANQSHMHNHQSESTNNFATESITHRSNSPLNSLQLRFNKYLAMITTNSGIINKTIAENKALKILGTEGIRLISNPLFWQLVAKDRHINDIFTALIGRKSSIESWVYSNPLVGPNERKMLIHLLLIWEQNRAKKLAILHNDYERQLKSDNTDEYMQQINKASQEQEEIQCLISQIIGIEKKDDYNVQMLLSELYRDRLAKTETANLVEDHQLSYEIIKSSLKNNLDTSSQEIQKLKNHFKNIDLAKVKKEQQKFLLDTNSKILTSTLDSIGYGLIKDLAPSLISERENITLKETKLRGVFIGHYLNDEQLTILHHIFHKEKEVQNILKKKVFCQNDRFELEAYLIKYAQKNKSFYNNSYFVHTLLNIHMPTKTLPQKNSYNTKSIMSLFTVMKIKNSLLEVNNSLELVDFISNISLRYGSIEFIKYLYLFRDTLCDYLSNQPVNKQAIVDGLALISHSNFFQNLILIDIQSEKKLYKLLKEDNFF